ncbi:hypothetical protein DXD76_04085 [Firmicutes bacterium TM09-10]|nr:hypothetical protein DXD76_04085 [Firmicutes bacterium TM09-10]
MVHRHREGSCIVKSTKTEEETVATPKKHGIMRILWRKVFCGQLQNTEEQKALHCTQEENLC